ncbi:MAG TPA: SDR family oxidoreductase, partial [Patescibacteria group bacterium]|nr:SDR family oxidoreductase [Patescibacteria group bacterium]
GFPAIAHYCASKGGIVAFTEALAVELAPYGILVNAIAPGVIETEMTQGLLSDEKSKEGLFARIPLKRAGKAQEIAHSIAFLVSDEASYVTGATLIVDGGYLAG